MRFTVTLAAMALLFGMAATAAAAASQRDIVGAWDAFDDSCQSGYLEYRTNGEFQQVYRQSQAIWIIDPIWGNGAYRVEGDILITSEEKFDGSMRVETKQRMRFMDDDSMAVEYLDLVWIDGETNDVKTVESFTENWSRCPAGTADHVIPVAGFVDVDPELLIGHWGWERGCTTGYVDYTRDGRIELFETEPDKVEEFKYGFYEIKGRVLLEVYAYESGVWKSESNYAFDDHGRLFFTDGMNPTWSEPSGATEASDPFFEVLFNCAEAEVEAVTVTDTPKDEAMDLDGMLFDSDVARVARIIAESKSRCNVSNNKPKAAADCIDYAWSAIDVSGDGLLSLSEIARALRMIAKWSAHEQARNQQAPLDSETKLGIHILGVIFSPLGAKPLLHSYDYDDDGLLSREELFADMEFNAALALSQQSMADAIDMESILEKLQLILQLTMP